MAIAEHVSCVKLDVPWAVSLVGSSIESMWELTNHRGYIDAVQIRFLDANRHETIHQFEAAAAALRRVTPAPDAMTKSGRHEYSAALRVFSETMALEVLSDALGEPTTGYNVGDPVGRKGGARKQTGWILQAPLERTRPLDEHVRALVDFAEANLDALARLRPACSAIDVFCGVFAEPDSQGGWEFPSLLLARLSAMELRVIFDLY